MERAFSVFYDNAGIGTHRVVVSVMYMTDVRMPCLLRSGAADTTPAQLRHALHNRPLSLQIAEMSGLEGVRRFVLDVFREIEHGKSPTEPTQGQGDPGAS